MALAQAHEIDVLVLNEPSAGDHFESPVKTISEYSYSSVG